jgi:hypothetical protein
MVNHLLCVTWKACIKISLQALIMQQVVTMIFHSPLVVWGLVSFRSVSELMVGVLVSSKLKILLHRQVQASSKELVSCLWKNWNVTVIDNSCLGKAAAFWSPNAQFRGLKAWNQSIHASPSFQFIGEIIFLFLQSAQRPSVYMFFCQYEGKVLNTLISNWLVLFSILQ